MNVFQKIALVNKINKAWKKSKKSIDSKKDLAEKVRKQIDKILLEIKELTKLLPEFKNIYYEILDIIEAIK